MYKYLNNRTMLVKSPNRRYFHSFINNYSNNGMWNLWFGDLRNGFCRMGPPPPNNNNNRWFETGAALILLIVSQKGNFNSSDRKKKFK